MTATIITTVVVGNVYNECHLFLSNGLEDRRNRLNSMRTTADCTVALINGWFNSSPPRFWD